MRTLKWRTSGPVSKQKLEPGFGYLNPDIREIQVPEPTTTTIYTLTILDGIGQRAVKQYAVKPRTT